MPCYLLTYHAYGTWLPNRPRGFVHWRRGLQPRDARLAEFYRANMASESASFSLVAQACVIRGTLHACEHLEVRCHAVATDGSHVHLLVSWQQDRNWQSLSQTIKTSLTRRLNEQVERKKWFSKGGSRRRIKDQQHYDYLLTTYLPRHRGRFWREHQSATSDA